MKRLTQQLAIVIVVILFFVSWLNAGRSAGAAIENNKNNSAQGTRSAAAIYKSMCASCHGKDGRARTLKAKFNSARNLTDASWQERVTDERIFNSIMNGRNKMPAYGKKLSDAEIESLVAHVRGLKK